jgi:hypothetical protein
MWHHSGRPFLQRHLPFWLASLASQLLVLLIPVVGVIYPMFRLLPALYGWSMRRRIFRLYGELKFLEAELEARGAGQAGPELSARLEQIEQRANHTQVPKAFAHFLYTLCLHIELVRARIAKAGASGQREREAITDRASPPPRAGAAELQPRGAPPAAAAERALLRHPCPLLDR